jgi:energy-coupling factor transporter ATP-binding protein EcfA2
MKYKDLVSFEPITSVVQLRNADKPQMAQELVSSFVISKSMEENFTKLIFPHLQFEHPHDNKALMIIGNYGTGKSHMLSVISALAEDETSVHFVTNPSVKASALQIAGKFKVIRMEVGGVQTPLETIILRNTLEPNLATWGVPFKFSASNTISNFKDGFLSMMDAFAQKYPDQGILIVIDELLEFFKGKNQQEQIQDFGFFRQLAEICKDTRLRVVVGMQESIFDSPQFMFVSDYVNKIKDRTEIVTIQKEDIRFVVAQRLLKKDANQKAKIREYLEQFKPYYANLTSDFENFVDLFPLHPSYLEAFSRMKRVEKREVLKSVSKELTAILDNEIPEKSLELVTIDRYWKTVNNDAALNAYEGIREVKDCNHTLHSKVQSTIKPMYRVLADRIIDALSLQRLESTDVATPIGLTAMELKDNLCLFNQMTIEMGSGEGDQDLLTFVESTLKEIMKAVNGQFIERNNEGQYFINIHKTFDFEQTIATRIEQMNADDVNNYYFAVMKLILECPKEAAFMTSQIWDYELQFQGHKMFRKGWLFFGTPNERPTAVPEKDFYLFFIPPKGTHKYKDESKPDELIIKYVGQDEEFEAKLKEFAAASLLADSSSKTYKGTYQNKADTNLAYLTSWMRKNILNAFTFTYCGKTKTLTEWTAKTSLREITDISDNQVLSAKEAIDAIAGYCLKQNFEDLAPCYPSFTTRISYTNFIQTVNDAYKAVVFNTNYSQTALSVLNGLQLLENGNLHPRSSIYAKWILAKLDNKPNGVVLNNDELLELIHDDYYCLKDYRLEKEFVSVILVSLIASGDIVLTLKGKKYDASNIRDLISGGATELASFNSIDKPKDWNAAILGSLLKLFGLQEGLVLSIKNGDESVISSMQDKNQEIINQLASDAYKVKNGLVFLGSDIPSGKSGVDDHQTFIENLKSELESFKAYNNIGRLKNYKKPVDEINALADNLRKEQSLFSFYKFADEANGIYLWLENAKTILPPGDSWIEDFEEAKELSISYIEDWDSSRFDEIRAILQEQKSTFIKHYSLLHSKARLAGSQINAYNALLKSPIVIKLTQLSKIKLLPGGDFSLIHDRLLKLKTCSGLSEKELETNPVCPHCSYKPAFDGNEDAGFVLKQISEKLDELLEKWTATLLENLQDPFNAQSIKLMKQEEQDSIQEFLKTEELPESIDDSFITILERALKGLVKKSVKRDDICKRLLGNGKPVTIEELRSNFEKLVDELSSGEEKEKIRVVLDQVEDKK